MDLSQRCNNSWTQMMFTIMKHLSIKFVGLLCHRTLDNGEVDFHTERVKQSCSNEIGKDAKSVEDIGPHEEGVSRVLL